MKTVTGDLVQLALNGDFDVIVHGCNCYCEMGAGVARAIRQAFPEAYAADCETQEGGKDKLGSLSHAEVERAGHRITIVNAYTQLHWKGSGVKADYDAIRSCMRLIKEKFSGKRIAYPRIGAGSAGGDWDTISSIIDEQLQGEHHTLVEFSGQPQ